MSEKELNQKEFEKIVREKGARNACSEGKFSHSCPWCRSTLLKNCGLNLMGPDTFGEKTVVHKYIVECENCGKFAIVFTSAGNGKLLTDYIKEAKRLGLWD